jgi:hypothetical protein
MKLRQEFLDAAHRMFRDLVAGGIDRAHAYACIILYLEALNGRSEGAWARFYRAVAERLAAAEARAPLPEAAQSLRTLLDDDFGSRIIGRLVERNVREASLSS